MKWKTQRAQHTNQPAKQTHARNYYIIHSVRVSVSVCVPCLYFFACFSPFRTFMEWDSTYESVCINFFLSTFGFFLLNVCKSSSSSHCCCSRRFIQHFFSSKPIAWMNCVCVCGSALALVPNAAAQRTIFMNGVCKKTIFFCSPFRYLFRVDCCFIFFFAFALLLNK